MDRFQPGPDVLEADKSNLLQDLIIRFNASSIFLFEVAYEPPQFQGLKTAHKTFTTELSGKSK
jgi:hypothetical protein